MTGVPGLKSSMLYNTTWGPLLKPYLEVGFYSTLPQSNELDWPMWHGCLSWSPIQLLADFMYLNFLDRNRDKWNKETSEQFFKQNFNLLHFIDLLELSQIAIAHICDSEFNQFSMTANDNHNVTSDTKSTQNRAQENIYFS